MQNSLLPFLLKGTTTLIEEPQKKEQKCKDTKLKDFTISSTYDVKITEITDLDIHKQRLTLIPKDFGFHQETIIAYEINQEYFSVPRYYGIKYWGFSETNSMISGNEINVNFHGSLNDIQIESTTTILTSIQKPPYGNMLVLPCGYGKTVCSIYIATKLKKKTIILVHKTFLIEQWIERIKQFAPTAKVGKIQQNIVEDGDFVVAMIQSIVRRNYSILSEFGFCLVDECHHLAAPYFAKALKIIPAKFRLGLSATPERRDGLTQLLFYSMGEIAHKVERENENTKVSCLLYNAQKQKEIKLKNGNISLGLMLNILIKDNVRNDHILKHIVRYCSANRHIIVLSDRIIQLKWFESKLTEHNIASSLYIGKSTDEERRNAINSQIILSTFVMAKEGLDIPKLDTLIMATPKTDIEQAIGRIQRKHPNKKIPLVLDIIDTFSIFENMRWKRHSFYKSQKLHCQTFNIDDDNMNLFI